MANLYEILFRFRPDGTLRGSHVIDWAEDGKHSGSARPMTQDDIDAIGGILDYAHAARIAELTQQIADLRTAHAEEIADLQAARAGDATLAQRLAEIFTGLPDAVQVAFARDYASVRTLLEAGRPDLAASVVAQLDIPAELESVRATILAALTTPT